MLCFRHHHSTMMHSEELHMHDDRESLREMQETEETKSSSNNTVERATVAQKREIA